MIIQYFRFYSAKSLLISEHEKRQNEQINFLRIENGDSDDDVLEVSNDEEEDELVRWEHEQIRKGVSSQKV